MRKAIFTFSRKLEAYIKTRKVTSWKTFLTIIDVTHYLDFHDNFLFKTLEQLFAEHLLNNPKFVL